jgi:hypothetical protein
MRRRKARRAAAHKRARDPRRVDQLGGKVSSEVTPTFSVMQPVYDTRRCIGFIMRRGRQGCAAYDADDTLIGIFATPTAAATAVELAASARAFIDAKFESDGVRDWLFDNMWGRG